MQTCTINSTMSRIESLENFCDSLIHVRTRFRLEHFIGKRVTYYLLIIYSILFESAASGFWMILSVSPDIMFIKNVWIAYLDYALFLQAYYTVQGEGEFEYLYLVVPLQFGNIVLRFQVPRLCIQVFPTFDCTRYGRKTSNFSSGR